MPRVALVAVLLAAALPGAASAATVQGAGRDVIAVANSEAGTVTIVDARTFARLKEIDVVPDGREPDPAFDPEQAAAYPVVKGEVGENFAQDIDVSPDGRTLYVSRGHLGNAAAFDIATGRLLWRVAVDGFRSDHATLSLDGKRLFVSALTADKVHVIDTATGMLLDDFPTGTWPHDNHLSHDGRLLYNAGIGNMLVPDGADGEKILTVVDANTLEVKRSLVFEQGIRPFVVTHDEKLMYAQLSYLHGFIEYDLAAGKKLRTVDLPISEEARRLPREDYPLEVAHHGLAMERDESTLCAAGSLSDYVALVERPSLRVAKVIPVPDEPGWAANSPDGRYCVVSSRGETANVISVIDWDERRVVAQLPVGDHPQHVLGARIPSSVLGVDPRVRPIKVGRRCRGGFLRVRLGGDLSHLRRVVFRVGSRSVTDAEPPFAARLRASSSRLGVRAELAGGGFHDLRRAAPRC